MRFPFAQEPEETPRPFGLVGDRSYWIVGSEITFSTGPGIGAMTCVSLNEGAMTCVSLNEGAMICVSLNEGAIAHVE